MAPAKEPVLPDLLPKGLALVLCGTAAGTASARAGAYYAHPQNKFWRTLFEARITPRLLTPLDFPLLPSLGIGLTDIAKHSFGMDHQLPRDSLGAQAVQALRARIEKAAPHHLAFTSLNAGRKALGAKAVAGEQEINWGGTRLWILPSPSPVAGNHWDAAPWIALGRALARVRPVAM